MLKLDTREVLDRPGEINKSAIRVVAKFLTKNTPYHYLSANIP